MEGVDRHLLVIGETADMPQYTPTEQRLLAILADGLPHTKTELLTALDDELAAQSTLSVWVTYLNKKLRTIGQEVVCRSFGRFNKYQHVNLRNGGTAPDPAVADAYQQVRIVSDDE